MDSDSESPSPTASLFENGRWSPLSQTTYLVENFILKIFCRESFFLRPIYFCEAKMWHKKFCTDVGGGGGTYNMLLLAPNLTLFRKVPPLSPKCSISQY